MSNFSEPTKEQKETRSPSPVSRQTRESREQQIITPYLHIENVNKNFGKFVALRDIYLDVYPGEFICLLGPSGCGKTTLLRIIAGLEIQTSGTVRQGGKDVSRLPASQRDFGIVFQSYALFPNLTASQNIAYGLQNAKESPEKIKTRVAELLDIVGLGEMGHKYPAQLSGGQQQRVALARALALSPGLLLLDEPLSALDAQVRVKLRTEIRDLQQRLNVTTIMVTHDQAEALAMADRVVVMDKGYIAQIGTPNAVYKHPHTPFVANFIGVMNLLKGVVSAPNYVRCGNLILQLDTEDLPPNSPVTLAVRPEAIRCLKPTEIDKQDIPNLIRGELEGVEFLGSIYHLTVSPQGDAKEELKIELTTEQVQDLDLRLGQTLVLQLPPDQIKLFAGE